MIFKDTPSKIFYHFFKQKIDNKEITSEEIAHKFNIYLKNPSGFLSGLKTGKAGITVELILLAQEHYGLNPCSLFEKQHINTVAEEDEHPPLYGNDRMMEIISSQAATIATQAATIAKLTNAQGNAGNRQASA